jgi:hypothetical protein
MTGDFSRTSQDWTKSYTGVLMQQGRVQVDADWNEQLALAQHRTHAETQDVIGGSGTAMDEGGFRISLTPTHDDFFIHPGRYYVDGLLCEIDPEWVAASIAETGATWSATLSSAWLDGRPIAEYDWVEIKIENQTGSTFVQVTSVPQPTTQAAAEPVELVLGNASSSLSQGSARLRRALTYVTQPFYPSPDLNPSLSSPPSKAPGSGLTLEDGYYIVYLEAWQRSVNALEDPHIREVALDGPDTAERLQTVWQVRLLPVSAKAGENLCEGDPREWERLIAAVTTTGQMNAQSTPPQTSTNPCMLPPAAGFQGLQNQLYRIEIFQAGDRSKATFVWSRDNGMVETSIVSVNSSTPNVVTVTSLGTDDLHSFAINDWVEIVDRNDELDGTTRFLAQIVAPAPDPVSLQITLSAPVPQPYFDGINTPPHPTTNNYRLRRWDISGSSVTANGIPIQPGWMPIESGVQVCFTDGYYAPRAWWLIPARTATADIEWPPFQVPNTEPIPQPPFGTARHFCRIGSVFSSEGYWTFGDCRNLFPPLTVLKGLYYVGGDGQEAMPGQPLPEPLQVRVANGGWPVQGAQVQFAFTQANVSGRFTSGMPSPSAFIAVLVTTGADGIARCNWTLPSNWTPVAPIQPPAGPPAFQVIATVVQPALHDPDGNPIYMPVVFSAQWSTADQVAYLPSGSCPTLSAVSTVQEALDKLCPPALYYVGGDGQDALPGQQLPLPLQVCVATGASPVANGKAQVTFAVVEPSTALLSAVRGVPGTSAPLSVPTDSNGMASCYWTLDKTTPDQQVTATLSNSSAPPIYFNANFDPGVHITNIQYRESPYKGNAEWVNLTNNAVIPAYYFSNQAAVQVLCDGELSASTVNRGSCFLSLDWPSGSQEGQVVEASFLARGASLPGTFLPLILDASLSVVANEETILWQPTISAQLVIANAGSALEGLPFPPRILARLTIKGNFILSAKNTLYLDGDAFFDAGGSLGSFGSGDGRRGGTFEMYFWLTWNVLLTFPWTREVVSPSNAVPSPWAAKTQYALGATVIDSHGNLEQATMAGTSGGNQPTWPTATGATVTDGTTAWQLQAPSYSLNFGALAAAQTILVTNNSGSQITVQASIAPGSSSAFTVTAEMILSPGRSGALSVTYKPPVAATTATGTLVITTSDPSAPSISVGLSGTGVAAGIGVIDVPVLEVPGTVSFPAQTISTTSAPQPVTLTASKTNGTTAVSIYSAEIVGPNAGEFAIESNLCTNLAAGQSCTIGVTFTPSQSGPRAALLVINSNNVANGTQAVLLMAGVS